MRRQRAVVLAVGAVLLIFCGCARSPQAKEAKYLDKGKKALQQKDYGVAVLHFKTAIQAMPRDAEPYYQLGLAYMGAHAYNEAASYFQKATELNPKLADAQLKLAELLTTSRSLDQVTEAQKRTEDVLSLAPNNIDALDVLAVTEMRLGKPESAEAHLEEALRKAPASLQSSIALAKARLQRKDVAGAEEALKQAAAQAPKSPQPSVALAGFYLGQGRTPEAEQQLRHALQIDPKNGPALYALASMQARAGQADQAEQTFRQLSALPDQQYKPMHATYLFQSGKRDQAVTEFEKLAKDNPDDRTLRTDLVRAYLSTNRIGDAEKVLTAALKKNDLDADALLMRSRIYIGSRKLTEAQNDLDRVLHFRSESPEAHYLLAKVQQARGDATIQRQELGQTLLLDPHYTAARLDLAQALISNRGAQAALELLDGAPDDQKKLVVIVVERNWALMALGRKDEARKGVDQVLAVTKAPEALVQDALLKFDQKDYAGSRASAEAVLKLSPDDTRALNILDRSYVSEKQAAAGVQKVREYAASRPSSTPVQAFLGDLLEASGDKAGARKAFEAAQAASPASMGPQLSLARLDISEGKRDDARKRLSAVVSANPASLDGQLMWGQLEEADGKPAAAIDHYRKALALNEKNPVTLNALAYLLADGKQPDEALRYAQEAKQLAPDNPAVDDTLGWTYYQKGMYSLAVTHLGDAVAKGSTPVRQYHLAMACLRAGDAKRGRQVLDAALKVDPNLPEAQAARQLFSSASK